MKRNLIFSVILLNSILYAYGQSYLTTRYDMKDGLISNSIDCLIQDSLGFLWIGNNHGLTKYNGNKFERYKSPESYGNVVGILESLHLDKTGNIFYKVMRGKVVFDYKKNNFYYFECDTIATKKVSKSGEVVGVAPMGNMDKDGNCWYSSGKDIYRFDGKTTVLMEMRGYHFGSTLSLILDNKNNIWAQFENSLFKYNGKEWEFVDNIPCEDRLQSMFIDSKGIKWLTGGNCIYSLKGHTFTKVVGTDPNIGNYGNYNFTSIFEDKTGNIWLNCEKGLARFQSNSFTISLPLQKEIKHIIVADNGNFILNSSSECFVKTETSLTKLDLDKFISSEYKIQTVLVDRENNIWIGTSNGLLKCKSSVIYNFSIDEKEKQDMTMMSGDLFFQIKYVDSKGRKIIQGSKDWYSSSEIANWFIISDKGITRIKELNNTGDCSIIEFNKMLYVNDGKNLWTIDKNNLVDKIVAIAPKKDVSGFYTDSKNRLWAYYSIKDFVLIEGDNIYKISADKERTSEKEYAPLVFNEDILGNIYLYLDKTIYHFNEGYKMFETVYNIKKPGTSIEMMNIDAFGQIWLYDPNQHFF